MIPLSSSHKGILYAAFSGMLYGFLGYFGMTLITQGHSSITNMLFWRFLLTTLVFAIVLIFTKRVILTTYQAFYALGAGILYALCAGLYFMASEYIGTGLSMVIFFTYPTMVALLNWIFHRHKITFFYYVSFILTGIGVFLLSDKENLTFDLYGVLLASLAALTYALYMVISKKQIHILDPMVSSFTVSVGCGLFFLVLCILDNSFFIPSSSFMWINLAGISVIATILPLLFLLISLKYINSTKASIMSVLEPIVTVIIGVLLLNESLNWLQVVGIITILAGTLSIQFDKNVEHK